jgi:hypothetical protein
MLCQKIYSQDLLLRIFDWNARLLKILTTLTTLQHKTIPEDDATSYDNEERTTRDTLLPTHRQITLKVFNSQNWLYVGRRCGLTSQIA